MNPLEYIYHPASAPILLLASTLLFLFWRLARKDAKTWEETVSEWKTDAQEWEHRWDQIMEENEKLRREIVDLAKGHSTPAPCETQS